MAKQRLLKKLSPFALGALAACTAVPHVTPLTAEQLPDGRVLLASPPVTGSDAQMEDRRIYWQTRLLVGTDRWRLAQSDADLHPAHFVDNFSCAAGFKLDLAQAPHLNALIQAFRKTEEARVVEEKNYWRRPRPFLDNNAPICVARSPDLMRSPAYPSGHTIAGYSMALILASLLPDRAAPILQRGRVIGESRVVCGVHWASDVHAGYQMASAFAVVGLANPAVRAELPSAKAELEKMRRQAKAPDAGICAIEADAAAHSPLTQM
ncbi:acid phosphatase [Kozakia baliensis]|uniref:acid phosphatase n=1 Tax=Kozakia baliensis TaxID=153496 RepID=UPI00068E6E14|nr:phosphatase PAP2 family protein [Kozakia baliensis]AOX21055.1 hypothetical protein A0U90_13075 [Kozakia baliensis]